MDREIKKFPKIIFYIFLVYFILFAIYISWYIYFRNTYILSKVEGTSMQNTLNPGITSENEVEDLVYINKNKQPERFDIIVINDYKTSSTTKTEMKLIKRAIGLGGDWLTIKKAADGYFHVFTLNWQTQEIYCLNEDYVKDYEGWTYGPDSVYDSVITYNNQEYEKAFFERFLSGGAYTVEEVDGVLFFQVPDYEIFYLGDNRGRSSDSRARGTAKIAKVEGVAEIILKGVGDDEGNLLGAKISALSAFYWNKLENYFSR